MCDDFPWRNYDNSKLQKEYNNLKKHIKKYDLNEGEIIPYKRIGINCCDIFFQYSRLSTISQDRKEPCTKLWISWRNRIIKYHNKRILKKNNDLYGTITFMFHPPSHFSPFISAVLYKYFNAKTVFDPYAGWGNRCLGAMAMNINYIGIDSNPELKLPFKNLLESYKYDSNIIFINDKCENIDTVKYEFDLTFTSPPFWNDKKMLEKYNNCITSYELFLETSLYPIFNICIKKSIVCLYINEKMYNSIKIKFGDCFKIFEFKSPTNNKKNSSKINKIYCWKSV
jgi:hypothetical protein